MLQGTILATLDPSIDKSSCAGRPQRHEPPARALDRPHPEIQADPVRRREAIGTAEQPSSAECSLPQLSAAENAFLPHLPAPELKIPNEFEHTARHTRPNDTPNNFVLQPPQRQNALLDPNVPYTQTVCVLPESRYLRYPNDPDGMAPTGEAKMSETTNDSINDQTPSLPEHTAKQILPDTVTMVPDSRSRKLNLGTMKFENAADAAVLEVPAEVYSWCNETNANAVKLNLYDLSRHVCTSLLARGADEATCMAEAKKTCDVLARIVLSRFMSLRARTGPDTIAEEHARLVSRLRASHKVQKGICRAIVDSGASSHFVTADTHLENVRGSNGAKVMTAGGDTESINEIGDITLTEGVKLTDCKKVTSFPHSLVSVSKLCQIVGCVAFDNMHVYAVSTKGGKTGKTPIGDVTSNRLYSFDLRALQRHCEKHKYLLPTEGGQTIWPTPDTANLATHIGTIGDTANGHLHAACYEDGTCAVASAVSDVEATKILQTFHQIWGHISAKKMAKLHEQGVDLGGDVSAKQILGLQWWCDRGDAVSFHQDLPQDTHESSASGLWAGVG